jgi:tetratricopeptide (TPR) repeat protein
MSNDPSRVCASDRFPRWLLMAALALAAPLALASGLPPQAVAVDAALKGGKTKDAHRLSEVWVKNQPEEPRAWQWHSRSSCQMAQEAGMLGKMRWAGVCRQALERFLELAPTSLEALQGMTQYYLAAPSVVGGGRDKVEGLIERVGAQPGRGEYLRAQLAAQDKDLAQAESLLREAMTADPSEVAYLLDLGGLLAAQERNDEARRAYLKVLDSKPDHALTHYQLGRLAALSGEALEAGLDHLDQFLRLGERPQGLTEAAARWRRALVLDQLGRRDEAIADLQLALKLDKDFDRAREDLQRLQKAG